MSKTSSHCHVFIPFIDQYRVLTSITYHCTCLIDQTHPWCRFVTVLNGRLYQLCNVKTYKRYMSDSLIHHHHWSPCAYPIHHSKGLTQLDEICLTLLMHILTCTAFAVSNLTSLNFRNIKLNRLATESRAC